MVSTPVLLVYHWLRCLHSRRSSRWNERCAPTWSGSSTSSPRRCTIFDIAFSQIAVSTVQDHHGTSATQDPPPHHPSHCQHAQFQRSAAQNRTQAGVMVSSMSTPSLLTSHRPHFDFEHPILVPLSYTILATTPLLQPKTAMALTGDE